jgi:hypothetical protein
MKLSHKLSAVLILIGAIVVIGKPVKTRLNENLAIATLKTIRAAQRDFRQARGRYATLSELVQAGLLSSAFSDGKNWGYGFDMKVIGERYHVVAVPEQYSTNNYWGSGTMSVFMDETGVIRGNFGNRKEASLEDQPIAEKYQ